LFLYKHQILAFVTPVIITLAIAACARILLLFDGLAWPRHLGDLRRLEGRILITRNALDQRRRYVKEGVVLIRTNILREFISRRLRLL